MAGPADYNTMENDREALMKLFHLSDLHIGKRVNEFSMIEDQKYILSQILHAAKRERQMAYCFPEIFTTVRFQVQKRFRFLTRF